MALAAAMVKIEMASGAPTLVQQRGGFIGATLEWESKRLEVKGFRIHTGTAGTYGMQWLPALKALVCRYEVAFKDIAQPTGSGWARAYDNEMFDSDPVDGRTGGFEWDNVDRVSDSGVLIHASTARGRWVLTAPDWNRSRLAWSQIDSDTEEEWWLSSWTPIPANRPMVITMRRDSTPAPEEGVQPEDRPLYYTGIRFGRDWELRFEKWRKTQLLRRRAGEWYAVSEWDWDMQPFYSEAGSEKTLVVTIWPIDGKLLIINNQVSEQWLYEDDKDEFGRTGATRPISIPEAPIAFVGNGGPAHFGLHELAFDTRDDNWLLTKRAISLAERPATAPTPVVIGYVPTGTTAVVQKVDDDLTELGGTATNYTLGLRMAPDEDGRLTPCVRMIGLSYAPAVTIPSFSWSDKSAEFITGQGSREFDPERRHIMGTCSITLDNSAGTYSTIRGARVMRVWVGHGELNARYIGQCWIEEGTAESIADHLATFTIVDRINAFDDIQIGYRRPLDGMLVSDAIKEVLAWGYVHASEIGTIYSSGTRLPTTAYAQAQWSGASQAGLLDDSVAAVQFSPATTVRAALDFLMAFDYGTYLGYDGVAGEFFYSKLATTVVPVRTFTESDGPAAVDVIRREIGRRPRVRDIVSSVLVESRDRKTREKISAFGWDKTALQTTGSNRFRGGDKGKHEYDESLGEQRLVAMRCRYLYEWNRRLREERAWRALGQPTLFPPAPVLVSETGSGDERGYFVLRVGDEFDNTGSYQSTMDGAVWVA